MRLVGKKLYRVGPLKCFKGGGGGVPSAGHNSAMQSMQMAKIKKLEDEKKAREARSVSYLKHQKTLTDWTDESFTVIDKAITDADAFTG